MREAIGRAVVIAILLGAALAQAKDGAPPQHGAHPGKAKPTATVLYPLRSLGISAEASAALEASLRNEVLALPEVELIPSAAVAESLEREHDADCLARLACAASAASRAGASQFVSGTVSGLGDAVLVDLKLVDARSGQELRRITHPITGRQDLLIEILHAAAVELLAPERFVGRLDVKLVQSSDSGPPTPAPASDVAGALLFVDGKQVATLPLTAPIEGLAPGKRALRVAKPGFRDATLFVEIRFERTTQALVDLPRGELTSVAFLRADQPANPPPAPAASIAAAPPAPEPRAPWLKIAGWSGVGLGAVSAIVGVALHVKAYQTAAGLDAREATNSLGSSDVPLYSNVDTEVNAARALYVIAGVLGAGGGGLLLWDRHLDQQRASVSAQPVVLPNGGGVGVSGQF